MNKEIFWKGSNIENFWKNIEEEKNSSFLLTWLIAMKERETFLDNIF